MRGSPFSSAAEALLDRLGGQAELVERVRAVREIDPEGKALQVALARASAALARAYPDLAAPFFDEAFLRTAVVPLLVPLLTRQGRPELTELVRRWAAHLGQADPASWGQGPEASRAAAELLRWLEAGLANQPVLQPLGDPASLARVASEAEALQRALEEELPRALAEASRYAPVVEEARGRTAPQVFRSYFVGAYAPLSAFYLSPEPLFQGREEFVGREWLEAELDRFLEEHERGVWVVVGEAGVGKTAFLAHLVQERRYPHFFAELVPGRPEVTHLVQSLAAQLVARYQLGTYASREVLSSFLAHCPGFLMHLLRTAAERLTAGERLVLVVDGLDEVDPGLLQELLNLPRGVFLVASQRAAVEVRPELPMRVESLRAEDPRNFQDVEAYLRRAARQPALAEALRSRGQDEERFVEELKEKSAGNWIYLRRVVAELREGRRPWDPDRLPVGLAGYCAEYWGRWRGKPGWEETFAPLLASLAAAREPVSLETLAKWAGLEASPDLERLLTQEWRAFVRRTGDFYRLAHASLREFLAGEGAFADLSPAAQTLEGEMARRVQEAHRRIAEHYWGLAGEARERLAEVDGGYGLRHLAAHLACAGEWERLHQLVAEGEPPWAEVRYAAEGTYAGYLRDLELAWRRAEKEGTPTAVARLGRYALIRTSLNALNTSIPEELLAKLVNKGVWKPPALWAHACAQWQKGKHHQWGLRALTDLVAHLSGELREQILWGTWISVDMVQDKAESYKILFTLVPYLPDVLQEKVLHKVREALKTCGTRELRQLAANIPASVLENVATNIFSAIKTLDDDWLSFQILVAIAPCLPAHFLPELLAVARHSKDAFWRARTLAGIVPHVPEGMLGEVWRAAEEIEDEVNRAVVLAALAPRLPEDQRVRVLQRVLDVARKCMDRRLRDEVLARLACRLARMGWPAEALAVVKDVWDEDWCAWSLVEMAPHLPKELLPEALAVAKELPAITRERALAKLVLYIPTLEEALATARGIEHDLWRIPALASLASRLEGEAREQLLQEALDCLPSEPIFMLYYIYRTGFVLYLSGTAKEKVLKKALAYVKEMGGLLGAETLAHLAPHLPEGLLREALEAARRIGDEGWYARAVAALVPHLPEGLREGALQEALDTVRQTENGYMLAEALAELAPCLSENLWPEALATARGIDYEGWRAKALAGLVPHLPEGLLGEVQVALQEIKDEYWRARVLAKLAPRLAELGRPGEALATAKEIVPERVQAEALARVAPYLPAHLVDEALAVAEKMKDEHWRATTLVPLASRLAELGRPNEALAVARGIGYEGRRAQALAELVPHLPEELRELVAQEALATAQKMQSFSVRGCGDVLMELAPRLAHLGRYDEALEIVEELLGVLEEHGGKVLAAVAARLPENRLGEALDMVREIWGDSEARARALAGLAPRLAELGRYTEALDAADAVPPEEVLDKLVPCLPENLQREVLEKAVVLAKHIWKWEDRLPILITIAPFLPVDLLQEALAAARMIQDEYDRDELLARLASHLAELGDHAGSLTFARAIETDEQRAKALAGVACSLPEGLREQVLREAVDAARRIGWEWARARVLAELAPQLPNTLQRQALQEALDAAIAMEEKVDYRRADILKILAFRMAELGYYEKALVAARVIEKDAERVRVLAELAPQLPDALQRQALQEALDTAQGIEQEDARARALARVGCYLPEDLRGQVLREALSAARSIKENDVRAKALAEVACSLPEGLREQVLREAVDAARRIEWGETRAHVLVELAPRLSPALRKQVLQEALDAAIAIQDGVLQAQALATLTSRLIKLGYFEEALVAAQAITKNESRARFVIEVLPHLAMLGRYTEALSLAEGFEDDATRSYALAMLIPFLPADEQVRVLPEILHGVKKCSGYERDEALAALAPLLVKQPQPVIYSFWLEILGSLAHRGRAALLSDLTALEPVVYALGGETALRGMGRAVQYVTRWWP